MPFFSRLIFAWVCYFRVLFDGGFAARALRLHEGRELPEPQQPKAEKATEPAALPPPAAKPKAEPNVAAKPDTQGHELLALLQREGRLIDFLEQDITAFADEDVGAAARVVHEGCRKAVRAHVTLEPVRSEDEGANVEVAAGYAPQEIKLIGNVAGDPPFKGALRHKGWRATSFKLPVPTEGRDPKIIAPAEVEL